MISLDQTNWHQGDGRVLFTWALFNPNGPTFYCFGFRNARGRSEFFYRWLHMLGGHTWTINENSVGDTLEEAASNAFITLNNRFAETGEEIGPFHTIPSFVLAEPDDSIYETVRWLVRNAPQLQELDWGRELALLRTYGNGLFKRAGAAVRSAYDEALEEANDHAAHKFLEFTWARHQHIPSFREPVKLDYEPSTITDALFDEWWETIQDKEFYVRAAYQFSEAWVGAISYLDDESLEQHKHEQRLMDFDRLCSFLKNFHFPVWPADWRTTRIRRRIGLDEPEAEEAAPSEA